MHVAILASYGPPFSPPDIPGCVLWLRADTLALSNNDPVSSWPDSSGNSNDADQATGGEQPIYKVNIVNGLPAVRFDGVNDNLEFPTDPGASTTTFVVAAPNVAPASQLQYAIYIIGPAFWIGLRVAGTAWGTFLNSFGELNAGEDLNSGTFDLVELTTTPSSTYIYRNGIEKNNDADVISGPGTCCIGADPSGIRQANCDIAEVVIYDTVLTQSDRERVEGYLISKYSI